MNFPIVWNPKKIPSEKFLRESCQVKEEEKEELQPQEKWMKSIPSVDEKSQRVETERKKERKKNQNGGGMARWKGGIWRG